ncbi:MAG: hypothetical protein ACRD27_06570 [Terracidiphilus sp.]
MRLQAYAEPETRTICNSCREASKGRPVMQPSPTFRGAPPGAPCDARISNLVYQGMTIVAMILLLGTLGIF